MLNKAWNSMSRGGRQQHIDASEVKIEGRRPTGRQKKPWRRVQRESYDVKHGGRKAMYRCFRGQDRREEAPGRLRKTWRQCVEGVMKRRNIREEEVNDQSSKEDSQPL